MGEAPPDPARAVADVDVLVTDLFVGGASREALDLLRSHSWLELVASDLLLAEASTVIARLGDESLATDWHARLTAEATLVEPVGDGHPALTAAAGGAAATVLSLDDRLQSAATGAAIRPHLATSVKSPAAFVRLADPASLHETLVGGPYPGPDRDPRA